MGIHKIVQETIDRGYLLPEAEARLDRLCDRSPALEVEEYEEIVRLRQAIADGAVRVFSRKHFYNVMEELVEAEALARVAPLEHGAGARVDLGDIVAHALNRLPPLYATTRQGAEFQRGRAREECGAAIATQVTEALALTLARPTHEPGREPLGPPVSGGLPQRLEGMLDRWIAAIS